MVHFNVWLGAAFGLASAASWGAGDFCGGIATKRAGGYPVVIGSQLVGAAAVLALAVATGETMPPLSNMAWCGVAGLAGAAGLLALYRALAMGRMGVAAPISGILSAAIPVLVGGFFDGPPDVLKQAGFALGFVAVWLVATPPGAADRPAPGRDGFRALILPIAAGVGFGCFIATIARASGGVVFWPLVAARAASLALLVSMARIGGQSPLPERQNWPIVALAGILDAGGNAFVVLAAHAGRLDVAAVLSSLYPAVTVLLASWRLKERIGRWQFVGLVASLGAIVAITAG